eukprot:13126710-Heterocapsa_arctica.AAC.1
MAARMSHDLHLCKDARSPPMAVPADWHTMNYTIHPKGSNIIISSMQKRPKPASAEEVTTRYC